MDVLRTSLGPMFAGWECLILFRIIATSLTGAPRIIIRNGKELS